MYPRNLFGARLKIVLKTKVPYIKNKSGICNFACSSRTFSCIRKSWSFPLSHRRLIPHATPMVTHDSQ